MIIHNATYNVTLTDSNDSTIRMNGTIVLNPDYNNLNIIQMYKSTINSLYVIIILIFVGVTGSYYLTNKPNT